MHYSALIPIACLSLLTTLHAADYYASPSGSSSGSGSKDRPLDLTTALSTSSPVRPGDTLNLRGGRYRGKFISNLAGTSSARITVRSYPGEWAIIDSGISDNRHNILHVTGPYVTFRDFEIMSSDTKRQTSYSGSFPSDIRRGEGISLIAPHIRLINLVIHDTAQGISAWSESSGSEIYGCLIYHNGWQGPDRAHGHGVYAQNTSSTKLIQDNIVFNQFEKGLQIYGSSSSRIENFHIEGNAVFGSGVLSFNRNVAENLVVRGGAGPRGIVVRNNLFYGKNLDGKLLLGGDNARDLIFEGNYVPHLARFFEWQTINLSGNTFARDTTLLELYKPSNWTASAYKWDNNTFFCQESSYTPYGLYSPTSSGWSGKGLYFSGWQSATTYDRYSRYTKGKPSGTHVFVRPNRYEPGRANVIIYNWGLSSSVSVNLQNVLASGQSFEVRNAQNYFAAPILTSTYNGGSVSFPMTGLTVATPVGLSAPSSTAPEFGVFIVRALGSATTQPTSVLNTAPTISSISNQSTSEDTTLGPISFQISDLETVADKLGVVASSSNTRLIPNDNLILNGTSSSRTITVVPARDQSGSATITIAVNDGTTLSYRSFTVTVAAVNDAPTISSIASQKSYDGQSTSPISFTVADVDNSTDILTVTPRSGNTTLVPNSNLVVSGSGANRSLTITPAPGQYGSTTIYLRVSDGSTYRDTSFSFTSERSSGNTAPSISSIPDAFTQDDTPVGLDFVIGDAETHVDNLILSGHSSNTTIVPTGNIIVSGSGAGRRLTVTPASGQSGTAVITITVSDGSLSSRTSFSLTVESANNPPTLTRPDAQTTYGGQPITVAFTIGDDNTHPNDLFVRATSGNTTLVPASNLALGGSGANRTVTITPAPGQYGTMKVTLFVTDGSKSVDKGFYFTSAQ